MFTGITVADAFLKTGLVQRAMVVSGEYITHITETAQKEIEGPMDPRLACLTVGDAGAAVISGARSQRPRRLPRHRYGDAQPVQHPVRGQGDQRAPRRRDHVLDSIAATAVAVKRSVPYVAAVMNGTDGGRSTCDHILMHQTSEASINDAVFAVNRMFGHAAAHSGKSSTTWPSGETPPAQHIS